MANQELELIAQRLIKHHLDNDAHADAAAIAASMMPDGSFGDVRYDDTNNFDWKPVKHLANLRAMAVARRAGGGAELVEAVARGLAFWFRVKPVSSNWWYNQIGTQMQMGPIALLLKGELTPDLLGQCAGVLLDPTRVAPNVNTGQNLVWIATETVYRGLVTDNPEDVRLGISSITGEIKITELEGIQNDYSFYQHGPQIYNGGYGLGFMRDTCFWADITRGTSCAFPPEKLELLLGLLLEGDRWMVYGRFMDYSVQGREISRGGAMDKAPALLPACEVLARLCPHRKAEIEALAAMIRGEAGGCVTGHKHFYRSDYTSHRAAGYASSVRMTSSRMFGTEMMNSENRKGCWLPFGVHYTLTRGDEYTPLIPLMSWTHLPGTTVPQTLYTMPVFVTSDQEFAGGVSNGATGVSAMVMDKLDTRAQKAWFFVGGEIVCLGSGITSRADFPVHTTLNQCMRRGDVFADGELLCQDALRKPLLAVHHDGMGYRFFGKTDALVEIKTAKSDWLSFGNEKTAPDCEDSVFTFCADHGARPVNAAYAYAITPGVSRDAFFASGAPASRVLANREDVQAVAADDGTVYAVFYKPGELSIPGLNTIGVSAPCMLILSASGGERRAVAGVHIACPLAGVTEICVSFTHGVRRTVTAPLPQGALLGSTVTVPLR